jgi:hypothetical protein
MAGLAMVQGILYSLRIGMAVIGAFGMSRENRARMRDDWLGDIAQILRMRYEGEGCN